MTLLVISTTLNKCDDNCLMNSKDLKVIVAYVKITLCKWFGRTEENH